MFYLKEIVKLFKKHPVTNILLSLLTILTFFGAVNYSHIQQRLSSELPKIENEHYFNALIDGKINIPSIVRKVETLPGVKGVTRSQKKAQKQNLDKLNGNLDMTSEELSALGAMNTVRVALLPEVSQSSIKLIREYLKRLAGPGNITLGGVKKRIRNENAIKLMLANIKKWPLIAGIVTCLLFWITFYTLVRKQILQVSYIIENFQRRENVAFKVSLTYMISLVILAIGSSFIFFMPNIYSLVIASLVFILFSFSVVGNKEWARA